MPTYQYACTECEHRFEQVQAFSDASLTDCPVCGGRLRKVYGSVGVVFKGSGFYRTDSRAAAGAAPGADKGGEKSDGGASTPDSGKAAAKESSVGAGKSGDTSSSSTSTSGTSSSGSSGSSSSASSSASGGSGSSSSSSSNGSGKSAGKSTATKSRS